MVHSFLYKISNSLDRFVSSPYENFYWTRSWWLFYSFLRIFQVLSSGCRVWPISNVSLKICPRIDPSLARSPRIFGWTRSVLDIIHIEGPSSSIIFWQYILALCNNRVNTQWQALIRLTRVWSSDLQPQMGAKYNWRIDAKVTRKYYLRCDLSGNLKLILSIHSFTIFYVKKLMTRHKNVKHASIYTLQQRPIEIAHKTHKIKFTIKIPHTIYLHHHDNEDKSCTIM